MPDFGGLDRVTGLGVLLAAFVVLDQLLPTSSAVPLVRPLGLSVLGSVLGDGVCYNGSGVTLRHVHRGLSRRPPSSSAVPFIKPLC